MKGMIFLDDNFREVKLPKETCTKEEFKDFIHECYYCYFNIPERMKWFKKTYMKFDEMNSIFDKTQPDVYSYSEEDDYWFSELNKDITGHVLDVYHGKNKDGGFLIWAEI